MANNTWSPLSIVGPGFDLKTTDPLFTLGQVVQLNSEIPARIGKFAMYIRASGVIGNSSFATIDLTTISCLASSVDGGAGTAYFRNGSVAFAANEYGWVFCTKTAIPQ